MTGEIQTSPSGIAYRVFATSGEMARGVAERILEIGREAQRARSHFSIALSGGSTPRLIHREMIQPDLRGRIDWGRVDVFFGDERGVGPEHPDSNYGMAKQTLLDHVPLRWEHVHRMAGEAEDLDLAARHYAKTMKMRLKPDASGAPVLDLILLGLGSDGHTASLFPGTSALKEKKKFAVANDVPQLQTRRLTMTFPVLNAARMVIFMVRGESKAVIAQKILCAKGSRKPYPAAKVRPLGGDLLWMLDAAAAGELSPPE